MAKRKGATIADLTPDPSNARDHTPRNVGVIADSLQEVGAARSIVIDENGVILCGNATVEAAAEVGITKMQIVDGDGQTIIAVRRTGLTPRQKRRLAIADNRSTDLSGWKADVLEGMRGAGELDGFWTKPELDDLIGHATSRSAVNPDETPAARDTSIVRGQVFKLGRHRLMCGDATNADDVARLLAGSTPELMVTDPPYGVNYDPNWRWWNENTEKKGQVNNDDRADWSEAYRLFGGGIVYVWHGGLQSHVVQSSVVDAGFDVRAQIVWVKDRMALSRGDYHWKHEPCFYGVRRGAQGLRTKDRRQTTVWPIDTPDVEPFSTVWDIPAREDSGHGHGTQKPVECMARPMRNHHVETVYDPFVGSGTTIIAAEQEARACWAMELSPVYVQMAIDRWERFSGQVAEPAG